MEAQPEGTPCKVARTMHARIKLAKQARGMSPIVAARAPEVAAELAVLAAWVVPAAWVEPAIAVDQVREPWTVAGPVIALATSASPILPVPAIAAPLAAAE